MSINSSYSATRASDYINTTKERARERAQRQARMRYEKFRREHEAFRQFGLYDIGLFFKYAFRILLIPISIVLIINPLLFKFEKRDLINVIIFYTTALFLIRYFIKNRKDYLKIGKFYYNYRHLINFIFPRIQNTDILCYYSKNQKANARPYKISLFKTKDVKINNYGGIRGSDIRTKRIYTTVSIPRSQKAYYLHAFSSILKISMGFISIIFLNKEFGCWRFFIGLLSGSILSFLFLKIFRTKSKVSYFLSLGMIIRLSIIILCIYLLEDLAIIIIFIDPFIEAFLRLVTKDKIFSPIFKQYSKLEELFENRYQFYTEYPIWSILYPFFRWLV